jgi:hypothetical protein
MNLRGYLLKQAWYAIKARPIFLVLILSIPPSFSHAIVIRHDVNDKAYKELGEQYAASVAYINGCTSTLIEPHWLLTAAHCVYGRERKLSTATHLDKRYRIEFVTAHPWYNDKNDKFYDIALVQLKDPILNGRPAKLYSDQDEKGKPVVFVGKGTYGNGQIGYIEHDTVQRGATNTIIDVNEQTVSFRFDAPEKATRLEGISGPGDSGGPAFVELGSELYVAGVSSYQVPTKESPEAHYGVSEYYSRVSTYHQWLQSIMTTATNTTPPLVESMKSGSRRKLLNSIDEKTLADNSILSEAFYQSIVHNRTKLASLLIKQIDSAKDIRVNHVSLFEFALLANRKKYYEMLQKSLGDKVTHEKESALLVLLINHYKKSARIVDKARQVLEQGANINAKSAFSDTFGKTPLIVAIWDSNLDLVKYLIEQGADINTSDSMGDTPLMKAASLGKANIVRYLLERYADVQLTNINGKTAFDLAKNDNIKSIFESYH